MAREGRVVTSDVARPTPLRVASSDLRLGSDEAASSAPAPRMSFQDPARKSDRMRSSTALQRRHEDLSLCRTCSVKGDPHVEQRSLEETLEAARAADQTTRVIDWRDQVAAFGFEAVGALTALLPDRTLGMLAIAGLEIIARQGRPAERKSIIRSLAGALELVPPSEPRLPEGCHQAPWGRRDRREGGRWRPDLPHAQGLHRGEPDRVQRPLPP